MFYFFKKCHFLMLFSPQYREFWGLISFETIESKRRITCHYVWYILIPHFQYFSKINNLICLQNRWLYNIVVMLMIWFKFNGFQHIFSISANWILDKTVITVFLPLNNSCSSKFMFSFSYKTTWKGFNTI